MKKEHRTGMNPKQYIRSGGRLVHLVFLSLAVLYLVVALVGCMTMEMSGPAKETKGSVKVMSEAGLFRVAIKSEVDPIPLNEIHAWTLHVETDDGKPVNDAEIAGDGGMPAHGHGLPTEPRVAANLGNGDYRVEGLKFHMQGEWVVTFAITAGDNEDTVTIEFGL